MSGITQLDFQILDFIRENITCDILDEIFPVITSLANAGMLWILLTLIFLIIKPTRKMGVVMALALVLCGIVGNVTLKPLVARTRPFDVRPYITILISKPRDFSFPSGHTMVSFAAATSIVCFHKKWGAVVYVFAAFIAFSRLYLYVHYPSDVLTGIILGITFGLLSYFLLKRKWGGKNEKEIN